MSDDFLAREAAVLGSSFSPTSGGGGGDIDFDRAASAFPELDFDGDVPAPSAPAGGGFSSGLVDGFGDFEDSPLPNINGHSGQNVKVTGGDDEVDRFESEFPDISTVRSSFHIQP